MNKNNHEIIVLDIETTGLDPLRDSIVEIGLCFLNLDSGKIDPIFNILCREEKEINPYAWIFQNSDLLFEEVKECPYLDDFREELQSLLSLGNSITAYNQSFDFGFLEARKFVIEKKFWDPMLILTPILKIPKGWSYDAFYDYKWPSIQEAWNCLFPDEKYIEAHRALDDTMHEAKIIYETHKILLKRNPNYLEEY